MADGLTGRPRPTDVSPRMSPDRLAGPPADAGEPSAPWWWGLPALQATVACSGTGHRLRWTHGQLDLPDHGDPDRERALGALAGQQSGCLRLYDAWHRHSGDPAVLVAAPRHGGDAVYLPDPAASTASAAGAPAGGCASQPAAFGWVAYAPMPAVYRGGMPGRARPWPGGPGGPGPAGDGQDDDDLPLLLGLGTPWADRLTATVVDTLLSAADADRRGVGNGAGNQRSPSAVLSAALYGRVLAALRGWLGRPEMEIDLVPGGGYAAATVDLRADPVQVQLPARWLLDVWARGIAVVLGRFCVAATVDLGRRDIRAVTVDPDGQRSAITLRLPPIAQ